MNNPKSTFGISNNMPINRCIETLMSLVPLFNISLASQGEERVTTVVGGEEDLSLVTLLPFL